jgi:uncharacterized membrane protein
VLGGEMSKESRWHKTIHPVWKFITGSLLVFYGLFALIRETFLEQWQEMLTISNIIDSIAWYIWIIAGLMVFITDFPRI